MRLVEVLTGASQLPSCLCCRSVLGSRTSYIEGLFAVPSSESVSNRRARRARRAPDLSAVNGGHRFASVKIAAAYIEVNERTIRQMIADGRLTAYRGLGPRVLRVDLAEVDRVIGVQP